MAKNTLCDAEDLSSVPNQGTKISLALEQLSPPTTSREPECHNQRVCAAAKDLATTRPNSQSKIIN